MLTLSNLERPAGKKDKKRVGKGQVPVGDIKPDVVTKVKKRVPEECSSPFEVVKCH